MFTKRKSLIYSTILILTLLILITCCILILLKNKAFEKQYAINISFPPKNFYEKYYGCSLDSMLSFRKFSSYKLTNDETENKIIFKKIQLSIRNIVKRNDSENGIHVKFNLKTKYQDVIKLIDICVIEKVPTYILEDYDLWMMAGSNKELEKNYPFKYQKE